MNTYIIYIKNTEGSERQDMWYVHVCVSAHEAALQAWQAYDGYKSVDAPEDYSIRVANITGVQAGLYAIGNFSTGWLDVPNETFTGDTV